MSEPVTDDLLRELGKQLPVDRPDAARREGVRASLLAAADSARTPAPRRWLLVGGGFAVGALAAAAVALVVLRPADPTSDTASLHAPRADGAHEAYARIDASSAADLEHVVTPTATGTDERVRVRAGKVRLAVPPTRPGDRVRIATGDAEIESAGALEIVVTADALASVTVTSGTATVRLAGHAQPVFLAAGQTWRAEIQTADLSPSPVPLPVPVPVPGKVASTTAVAPVATTTMPDQVALARPSASTPAPAAVARTSMMTPAERVAPRPAVTAPTVPPPAESIAARPAVTAPTTTPPVAAIAVEQPAQPPAPVASGSETERRFRAGYELLRANQLAQAITELGAAAEAGNEPLAIDARYYQAVALIKAKRGGEAERALAQFLERGTTSTRRGRAAMMLGRLLADRGATAEARVWFELAARDPDATVAAAARAALTPR